MSKPSHGPRALSDILGELFTVRGYSRLQARQQLEDAWNKAVGEPMCCQTQLGEVRRGVLNVTVAHSTLLEELVAFRKPALLTALRCNAPATLIHDIRFQVGVVVAPSEHPAMKTLLAPTSLGELKPTRLCHPVPKGRAQVGKRSKPGRGSGDNPAQP
jgi:hypothetical protein